MKRLLSAVIVFILIISGVSGHPARAGEVDPIIHKLLHGGIGGISGGILGGKDGALAGASSAVIAETLADIMRPQVEAALTEIAHNAESAEAYHTQAEEYLGTQHNLILLTSVAITASLGGDVDTATCAADNALKNNANQLFKALVKKIGEKVVKETVKGATKDAVKTAVKEAVKKEAKTSAKKPVKAMTDKEFVQNIANRADKINPAKGPRAGTEKHTYAKKLGKRYQKMTGDRKDVKFEELYKGNEPYRTKDGVKGSTRPDVYNQKTGEVFDYKFGDAKLGPRQTQKLQDQMPVNADGSKVTVTEIKPNV